MNKTVKIVIAVVLVAALAVGAYFIFKPHTPPVTDVVAPVAATEEVAPVEEEPAPEEVTEETNEVADEEAVG